MGKRSHRRPVRYEKDQSGCMWGFISMFDFRHGSSTQKLLPDRKRGSRHAVGTIYSKNKFDMLSNLDEAFQGNLDGGKGNASPVKGRVDKPSVKKLIEEEMFSYQNLKVAKTNIETESKESSLGNSVPLKTNAKKAKCPRRKSLSMDSHDVDCDASSEFSCNPHNHSRHSSMNDLDLNILVHNHMQSISSVKNDHGSEVLPQVNHKHAQIEDKVKTAIEKFVSDTIHNGKDSNAGKFSHRELFDALQVISSDKELLMKLLQDTDSFFSKCSEDLVGAQDHKQVSATALNESAKDIDNVKQTKHKITGKRRNIFRKKKTREKTQSDESESAEAPNRIVILKPLAKGLQNPKTLGKFRSSPISDDSGKSKGPSARSGSHFSLAEIKKRLKYAMGKETHGCSDGKDKEESEKVNGKDNVGRKSPNRDHFFLERMTRPSTNNNRRGNIGKSKDSEMGVEKGAEVSSISRVSSTFYAEARKHLYEMLSNGDDDIKFPGEQVPKPLGRILSFSDYSSSPVRSPRRDREHGFAAYQLNVSPIQNLRKTNDDICSPKQIFNKCLVDQLVQSRESESNLSSDSHGNGVQTLDTNPNLSVDPVDEKKVKDTSSVIEDEAVIGGNLEVQKEIDTLDGPSGSRSVPIEEDYNLCVASSTTEGQRQPESFNQDPSEDKQLLSPSRTSSTTKVEEVECTSDASGRPSPISVLEPPFTEDDLSPKHSKRETVEVPLQPVRIQFEEYDCSLEEQVKRGNRIEQKKIIRDYVNAVLQACSLSWDQMWTKCLTCDHILDPCLCDQVVYFPNQLHLDRELLFDCINEVLMEVCCRNIGVSPWVWFVNPSSKPVTNFQRVELEVWEQVCWHLLPLPLPHTLDQIVRKDMGRSGAWGDRRFDVEDVGVEMSDAILLELMKDTIFNCMTENLESEIPSSEIELMEVIAAPSCKELAALTDDN